MEKIYKKAQIASFTDKEYNENVSEIMYEEDRRNQLATAYHQGKADVAAKMLSLGMDVELISKITGLSAEKISALCKGE